MENPSLPTSMEYLNEFVEEVILPTTQKQSSTAIHIPGTGRNSILRHLISHRENLDSKLKSKLANSYLLFVHTKDEGKLTSIWKSQLKLQGLEIKLTTPVEILHHITHELKKRVILCTTILNNPPDLNHLELLRQVNTMNIDLQIGIAKEVEISKLKDVLHELTQLASQNIYYMKLYCENDIHTVIQTQKDLHNIKISSTQEKEIFVKSGGHPQTARAFIRNLGLLEQDDPTSEELTQIQQSIWDSLLDTTQTWIFENIDKPKTNSIPSDFLEKTSLAKLQNKKLVFFSEMFEDYVRKIQKEAVPVVKEVNGEISINGKNIDLLLTGQELDIFKIFWSNRDKIVQRDDVAKQLWGENWAQKYSDWAIDQLISRTRKKIGDRGPKKLISTIRNKGFTLKTG